MATTNVYTRRIAPECANAGKSIKISGAILILVSVALVIMLIISTVYTYYNKSTSDETEDATRAVVALRAVDQKTKVSGGLQITCVVLGVVTMIVGIWHYMIGNHLSNCISNGQ